MNNIKSKVLLMLSLLLIFDSAAFSMDDDPYHHDGRFSTSSQVPFILGDEEHLIPINHYGLNTNRDLADVIYKALGITVSITTTNSDPILDAKCNFSRPLKITMKVSNEEQKKTLLETLKIKLEAARKRAKGLKDLSSMLRKGRVEVLSTLIERIIILDCNLILDHTELIEDILDLSKGVQKGFFHPNVEELINELLVGIMGFEAVV